MCTVEKAKKITDLVDRRQKAEGTLGDLNSLGESVYLKTIDYSWSFRGHISHTFRTKDIRLALEAELRDIEEELTSLGVNE